MDHKMLLKRNYLYRTNFTSNFDELASITGFSLLEVLIVLVITSILTMLAYPTYRDHFVQSRRNEAKLGLFEFSNKLENFKSLTNSYQNATLNTIGMPAETDDHSYQFIIKNLGETTYTIEAAPEGSQASADKQCGSLGLDETGNKTVSGTGSISDCW